MTVKSCERKEKSTAQLVIEVDKETFEQNVEKAYHKAKGKINMPGFRKGKAPRKMVESMYGKSVFYEDAINLLFPEVFQAALEETKLDAIGMPSVTAIDTTDGVLTMTVVTDLYPEVVLGQYKGLEVPKPDATVTEADVDAEIERIRARNGRTYTVERAAENGDTVVIDFEGFMDGVAFEGGKAENQSLKLGSGEFIPGFEDQLIGCSAGEDKTVEVTFPEDYKSKDLAGKPATFQCKIHEVKATELPELDDEFAKDVSTECNTMEELRAHTLTKLQGDRKAEIDGAFSNAALAAAAENVTVDIPQSMIDGAINNMVNNLQYQLQMSGMKLEDYLRMVGIDEKGMRESMVETATTRVRSELMLEQIAKIENIEVTAEDIEARYESLTKDSPLEIANIKEMFPEEDVKHDIMATRATAIIVDNAIPTAVEAEAKAE